MCWQLLTYITTLKCQSRRLVIFNPFYVHVKHCVNVNPMKKKTFLRVHKLSQLNYLSLKCHKISSKCSLNCYRVLHFATPA